MLSSNFRCDQNHNYHCHEFSHTLWPYLSQTEIFNKPTSKHFHPSLIICEKDRTLSEWSILHCPTIWIICLGCPEKNLPRIVLTKKKGFLILILWTWFIEAFLYNIKMRFSIVFASNCLLTKKRVLQYWQTSDQQNSWAHI